MYAKLLEEGAQHMAAVQQENNELKDKLKKEKLLVYHLQSELDNVNSVLEQQVIKFRCFEILN